MRLVLRKPASKLLADMDSFVSRSIEYNNIITYPEYLDNTYGYLLSNGFYNYQEYINYMASKAQAGDRDAMEVCLYYFGWRAEGAPTEILGYYYDQLISGGIDITRPDARSFIRLFLKEKDREVFKSNRPSTRRSYIASYKMTEISNRLLNYKTRKEIFDDLVLLLIERIYKYKQGERTLRKYIYDMFHLYVADYIQRTFKGRDFMKIQYAREDLSIEESIADDNVVFRVNHTSKDALYEWERQKSTLGPFWVAGHTHPIFKDLTHTERMLIRDNYFLKITERELAKHYEVSRALIKSRKKSGIQKIRKAIEEQDLWWNEQLGYETLDTDYLN